MWSDTTGRQREILRGHPTQRGQRQSHPRASRVVEVEDEGEDEDEVVGVVAAVGEAAAATRLH